MSQCKAKSKRSGNQCLKWAVRGRITCHMHGGTSMGPVTKAGKELSRKAAFRHGGYTKQAKTHQREMTALIRQSKDLLKGL
jgi:hypothetical protein